MSFRQDLPGYGEPMEGMWDGFQRINTDTRTGGIIGIFRHGSQESKRKVTINYLDLSKTYQVKTTAGDVVTVATGNALNTDGFEVTIKQLYSGELFEISLK